VSIHKGATVDLQINYHMLCGIYCLWEELILECGNPGPWSVHFETPCFNTCYT